MEHLGFINDKFQEPEKTNEFLQTLARVIEQGIDTSDAVKRVLNGEKPGTESEAKMTPFKMLAWFSLRSRWRRRKPGRVPQ